MLTPSILAIEDSSEKTSADDANENTLETELPVEHIEIEDSEPEAEPEMEQASEPSVELTVVPEVELTVPEIELNPMIKLDGLQLDLETDSPKIEPVTEEQPKSPEAALDGLELTMDSSEDEASDEEPTLDR